MDTENTSTESNESEVSVEPFGFESVEDQELDFDDEGQLVFPSDEESEENKEGDKQETKPKVELDPNSQEALKERLKGLQSKITPTFKENVELKKTNAELAKRIEALENRLSKEDKTKEESNKLSEIHKELEELGYEDKETRDRLIKVMQRMAGIDNKEKAQKETKEKVDDTDEFLKQKQDLAEQTLQIVGRYNGKAAPNVIEMRPFVEWIDNNFPDLISKVDLPVTFRMAEEVPFMMYIKETWPDEWVKLDAAGAYRIATDLRAAWYKKEGKDPNSFEHLKAFMKASENKNGGKSKKPTKEELVKETQEIQNETSAGIPGGETQKKGSSTPFLSNNHKQARKAIEDALSELGV